MLKTIQQYSTFDKQIDFLAFKQAVIHNKIWLASFYIHIFSITFCLLAGIIQFSKTVLNNYPALHRYIGKLYVYNILIINVPVCFVLGIFSNGGLLGILGFLIQNILWAYCTLQGLVAIKKKDIKQHTIFMTYSYAITVTAITFRIIKHLFYNAAIHNYTLFYGLNVWLALIINLLLAWVLINNRLLARKCKRIDQNKNS